MSKTKRTVDILSVKKLTVTNELIVAGEVAGATFDIGTEAANIINVAIQYTDASTANMADVANLDFYLADDAAGLTPSTVAPSVGISIGTDGALIESVTNLSGQAISELDGDIDINIEEAGAKTYYLVLVMPNRSLVVSAAITFA